MIDVTRVRLDAGAHTDPEDGMCAMELVAYVAGEPFTDHPKCTGRVIGTLMRSLNDGRHSGAHASRAGAALERRPDRRTPRIETRVKCCVAGCPARALHKRTFTISAEAWGEIETAVAFCCDHLDMLAAQMLPCLDLTIAGVERTS